MNNQTSNTTAPVVTYRKDYIAPTFNIDSVYLAFEIIAEDHVNVLNTMVMQRISPTEEPLRLDGEAITLLNISLNNTLLSESKKEYILDKESLMITVSPKTTEHFTLVISTRINPKENTLLSGLYYADGLFCTQCESSGFRRITYFMDHPDVLSHYTVKITADCNKYPILLSNGNCVHEKIQGSKKTVLWEDPFKKPAYLFALVAGDLACVEDYFITLSDRKVALKIYVDHGNEDKCAHAMASLKNAMRWDEEHYGREYDLDIYMIVAVRSFNMGAMENKGLNIFNAKYVLGRPETASDADFIGIERVIGHEYFHNWTGNRVTCRDWFQLSLKEGLTVFRDQQFSQDMQKSSVCRIQDVKTLRSHQFSEDASPMAHPVRPESYIEINNFYTVTIYNKGAEVIRMQHTLLGNDGFRKGMDLYFKRHDGQAVTIDDFVKAMEDANMRDFTQFKYWYSQAGTPEINAHSVYDAQKEQLTLTLTQSCPPTPGQPFKKPFHIPITIALWNEHKHPIPISQSLLELKQFNQTWVFDNISTKPIISLLGNFSAPVKLHMDYTDTELYLLIQAETNDFSRWEALQSLFYKHLLILIETYQAGKHLTLPAAVIDAYRQILHHPTIDMLSKAELLTLPNFLECGQYIGHIDVDGIESAREYYQQILGEELCDDLLSCYHTLDAKSSADMTAGAYGERRLKNTCLLYLIYAKHPEAKALAQRQLVHAHNMTDEVAALTGLMLIDDYTRDAAAQYFYNKWEHNDLILDKWFAAQAISPLTSTLMLIKKLLTNPKFDRKNPNKIKALLSTFWMNNPRCFHSIDGSGYAFLVPLILAFDKDNAFVSAGLARSMINWRLFDEKRQVLMQNALQTILADKTISKDLYEIVSKSVGDITC